MVKMLDTFLVLLQNAVASMTIKFKAESLICATWETSIEYPLITKALLNSKLFLKEMKSSLVNKLEPISWLLSGALDVSIFITMMKCENTQDHLIKGAFYVQKLLLARKCAK